MSLSTLLLFLAASSGATVIATQGRVFNRVRPSAKFFHCALCSGFWVGAAMLWCFWLANLLEEPPNVALTFVAACASSAVSHVLASFVSDRGLRIVTPHETTKRYWEL